MFGFRRQRTTLLIGALLFIFTLPPLTVPAKQRKLVLAGAEFPPFTGSELKENGFTTAIVRTALQRAGYEVEVFFGPFKRIQTMAAAGKCDGIVSAYYTHARAQKFLISDAVIVSEVVFLKKKDNPIQITSLEDLRPYSVGMIRGGSYSDAFENADWIRKTKVSTHHQSIMMLVEDRIDVMISQHKVALYALEKHLPQYINQVEVIQPPLMLKPAYLLISLNTPDKEEIITAFNTELQKLRADGTYKRIMDEHGY